MSEIELVFRALLQVVVRILPAYRLEDPKLAVEKHLIRGRKVDDYLLEKAAQATRRAYEYLGRTWVEKVNPADQNRLRGF